MNYSMAKLAEQIAKKLKGRAPYPTMMFHGQAYKIIEQGRDACIKVIGVDKVKECKYFEQDAES